SHSHALPTTLSSTLSLHDALPICLRQLPSKTQCRSASDSLAYEVLAGSSLRRSYQRSTRSARSVFHRLGSPTDSVEHAPGTARRSEEHTSELQSLRHLVCRLLLEK